MPAAAAQAKTQPSQSVDGRDHVFPKSGPSTIVRLKPATDRNLGNETITVDYNLFTSLADGRFQIAFESHTAAGAALGVSTSYTVGVSGLAVSMPAVTASPFEAGLIPTGKGTTVTIPIYTPHDSSWIEKLILQPVVGGEPFFQLQPAGPQGGTRQVTKETLKKFEGKGPFHIFYQTTDTTVKPSVVRESSRLEAEVGNRVEVLDAPIVQGANESNTNIDPAEVTESELLMTFPYTGTHSGDVLQWSVIGKGPEISATGSVIITDASEGEILPYIFFPVDRRVIDNDIDASISVSYSVASAGPPRKVLRSKVLNLTVGREVILHIPKVLEAGGLQDQLNPKAVINSATVEVAVEQMRAEDQFFVEWKGSFGISSVTVQVPGNPKTNKVTATIPPEVISKGLRPEGNVITVQYSFTRGQFTYHSEVLTLTLLPLEGLPTPTIDGVDDGVLRLLQLTDKARTRVAPWDLSGINQFKWMSHVGTFADGTPFTDDTYNVDQVTAEDDAKGVFPPTPVDKLRQLKDLSTLTIRFWVNYAQIPDKDSALLFGVATYIVQAIPATLPASAFANKVGAKQSIYPLDYEKGGFVTVAFKEMAVGQKINLDWILPDGTLAAIAAQDGVAGGRVDFPISREIIAASVRKVITLRYKVTTGKNTVISETQELTVQTILTKYLPQVLISNIADSGKLDLNAFAADLLAALAAWRLSVKAQRVWCTLRSMGVTPLNVLDGYVISEAERTSGLLNIKVLRSWLAALPRNAMISVNCRVAFDGSNNKDVAVDFPVTMYTVIAKLTVDTSDMVLNGLSIKIGWPRTGYESVGNTASRVAAGGWGKITYSSRNPAIASVNTNGLVVGNRWGDTIIDVKDVGGHTASYTVRVSNIYTLMVKEDQLTYPLIAPWIAGFTRGVSVDGINDMQRVYGARLPVGRHYWLGLYDYRASFYHYQNLGMYLANLNEQKFGAWALQRY